MSELATNWAGNVVYRAARVHRPASRDELRRIVAGSTKVRALGTGHSFNPLADTTGDLVSVAGLPPEIDIDSDARTVRVAAGVRYGELAVHLHGRGWALPNLGSLPHISVAGACATGTHGSGSRNGNLATSVSSLEMVTADGDVVAPDREGAVVALGALGVVTSLTLDLVPTYGIAQTVYFDSAPDLTALGSGYSVSVFTDWNGYHRIWCKRRVGDPVVEIDRSPLTVPAHPIEGQPAGACTEQLGVSGPWHERLPHFRLDHTPSVGAELQSEYLVPLADARAAVEAVSAIGGRLKPHLYVSELRAIAADDLWLSPGYGRDSLAIHFTWHLDRMAVDSVLPLIESALAPFAPRPHWGKLFQVPPGEIAARYPMYAAFQELRRGYDPRRKFGNDLLDRLLGP